MTRTALTMNGLAELRMRYARQGAKAPFKPEKQTLTNKKINAIIKPARGRAGLGPQQRNRIDRNNSELNELKSSKRSWGTLKQQKTDIKNRKGEKNMNKMSHEHAAMIMRIPRSPQDEAENAYCGKCGQAIDWKE